MSLRKYRAKRASRRSQPATEHDDDQQSDDQQSIEIAEENVEEHTDDTPNDAGVDNVSPEQVTREQEVWDAFREEHHQVLEQLPLSLHRAYALIKELDAQVDDHSSHLLQTLKGYIAARLAVAAQSATASDIPMDVDEHPQPTPSTSTPLQGDATTRRPSIRPLLSIRTRKSRRSSSPSVRDASPATREMLVAIARLSEEVMIAANEKVNLTRFACDLIDRHSRDIERAIKEQETSLSVGLRPGTHPASIILPEVVVPSATRVPRIVHSPIPDDDGPMAEPPPEPESEPNSELVAEHIVEEKNRKRNRGRLPRKASSSSPHRPVLTVTVPPLPVVAVDPVATEPIGPPVTVDEPTYCYCNGVSAGTMIACDGPDCKYQWFHLECLQIKEVPEGDYLCADCIKVTTKSSRRRKKR